MGFPTAVKIFVAVRGVLYASAFLLLWGWIALSARQFDDHLGFDVAEWLRPVGWLLAAAGAVLAALCVATFVGRGEGTPAPFDPPRKFVATGPYRYVRNPMYIGGFAMLLGIGLALGSPAVAVLAIGFLILAHVFVVRYEEPGLTRRFGEGYEQYKSSVHRWLPHGRPTDATRRSEELR